MGGAHLHDASYQVEVPQLSGFITGPRSPPKSLLSLGPVSKGRGYVALEIQSLKMPEEHASCTPGYTPMLEFPRLWPLGNTLLTYSQG